MPVMEIIRHKTFAVVCKTAKFVKVSCHRSFMVYGITMPYTQSVSSCFFTFNSFVHYAKHLSP